MSKPKKIILAVCAVAVLGVLVGYGYLLFVKDDAPDALDSGDLDQALSATTTVAGAAVPASDGAAGGASDVVDVDGVWSISQDSTLGYRVSEVLGGIDTEGAGRTNQVTGTLTLDGTRATAAEFTVDMASVTSDSDRRDGQFRTRIMSVDEFPTSTFVLTEPIDFGAIPAEGEQITASATGDLTLRGVTNSVTFDVTAQIEAGRIGVLGSIPVLFSEYEIPDPSNAFATVKDSGVLEFVLVFDRA
jgi:polyisoprenoid-binding protein YceI